MPPKHTPRLIATRPPTVLEGRISGPRSGTGAEAEAIEDGGELLHTTRLQNQRKKMPVGHVVGMHSDPDKEARRDLPADVSNGRAEPLGHLTGTQLGPEVVQSDHAEMRRTPRPLQRV